MSMKNQQLNFLWIPGTIFKYLPDFIMYRSVTKLNHTNINIF
jgi:hypothetical protein